MLEGRIEHRRELGLMALPRREKKGSVVVGPQADSGHLAGDLGFVDQRCRGREVAVHDLHVDE
jgi:hypothetical protein